jgi:hypothetical protein
VITKYWNNGAIGDHKNVPKIPAPAGDYKIPINGKKDDHKMKTKSTKMVIKILEISLKKSIKYWKCLQNNENKRDELKNEKKLEGWTNIFWSVATVNHINIKRTEKYVVFLIEYIFLAVFRK